MSRLRRGDPQAPAPLHAAPRARTCGASLSISMSTLGLYSLSGIMNRSKKAVVRSIINV